MVIEGVVEIEVAGVTYRLERGDSIYIGALQPHRSYNPGKKTAVIISAITPPSILAAASRRHKTMMPSPRSLITIDLDAVRKNTRLLKGKLQRESVCWPP